MLEVNNGLVKIDGRAKNGTPVDSEKYGKNAVDDFYDYAQKPIVNDNNTPAPILDFGLSPDAPERNAEKLDKFVKENDEYLASLPPLKFEYRYMPNIKDGKIDKAALLSTANEEMFGENEMSVKEMDYQFAPNEEFTSEALDINGDGKITNAEYSTSILAADMLSKSDKPDFNNIDGSINSTGMDAVLRYSKISNLSAAKALYASIYNKYNLDKE